MEDRWKAADRIECLIVNLLNDELRLQTNRLQILAGMLLALAAYLNTGPEDSPLAINALRKCVNLCLTDVSDYVEGKSMMEAHNGHDAGTHTG